ncbi:MAG: flavodoxin family protein [Desulfovibrio sp.]
MSTMNEQPPTDIVIFSCSHRPKGNSFDAAKLILQGIETAGGTGEILELNKFFLSPCTACGTCTKKGFCPIEEDDIPYLFHRLLSAKAVAFTSPIYFYALPSMFKTWIDRGQLYWEQKIQKHPEIVERPPMNTPVCFVAGQDKGEKLFEGARLSLKYFLANFNMKMNPLIALKSIDQRGDMSARNDLHEDLRSAGKAMVNSIVDQT